MFAYVRLLNGYSQLLVYKVPATLEQENLVGRIVKIPIRNRIDVAVVIKTSSISPQTNFVIKSIDSLEPFPTDTLYQQFIGQLNYYYQLNPFYCNERVRNFIIQQNKKKRKQKKQNDQAVKTSITLTSEQQKVVDFLMPCFDTPTYAPTLLHGVTGSGKTEVYKKLIMQALRTGKTALLMLPEVTLALQFERIMREQLDEGLVIFSFHSATLASDKRLLWERLLAKEPMLIIGVHLPILLPIPNLGLIILDEEHEIGYQEKKHPKINSKEAALLRAKLYSIPILLGSATPSLSSLYNVQTKGWHFFQLKQRFSGILPTIITTLLTDKKQRRNFWISQKLEDAIKDRLARKEQIIIFLNRRGFSFFVQCKSCSFIFSCAHCSVSLTLHANGVLACHYCGLQQQLPKLCSSCKAHESQFLKKGIGTQQIVTILEELFPNARIGRADHDVTSKKKMWQQTMKDFKVGNIDILVGTQTITKGYHFPRVTLVGVIWADLNLNFPIFNASETTLQQLIQVAGRAGRASQRSDVILQTMAEHDLFNHISEVDYMRFYDEEMALRKILHYPPYGRFAEIELKHTQEEQLEKESHALAVAVQSFARKASYQATILGPAKPPIYKIKNIHSRKIYIKSMHMQEVIAIFRSIDHAQYESKIFFTPNPLS